jgi:predicted lipoprotein with Yx(FWY)xxD motif
VTYNGMPLYRYAKDEDAGDAYGQGIGGIWFVVMPAAMGTPAASPAASPVASPAAGTAAVQTKHDAKLGTILADSKGLTLYRYTKDTTPGQSACSGACAKAWPPLTTAGAPTLAAGVPGTLGTITRTDGTKQVTYNGVPLYRYAKDEDAGDTYGQGLGGVWFVVMPAATSSSSNPGSYNYPGN